MGSRSVIGEAEIVERGTVAAPERLLSPEQKPAIPTLKVRVRDDAGVIVQIFHKGETPGHVDVGDRIRAEGVDRHGVLHAEHIYNETTASWVTRHGRCFIATAAAGAWSPEVVLLQRFREHHLRRSMLGGLLIGAYEQCSPPVAEVIRMHPALRALVRSAIVRPAARWAAWIMQASGEAD